MNIKEFPTFDRIIGIIALGLSVTSFLEFLKARTANGLLLIIIMMLVAGYLIYRRAERERKKREHRERTLFTYLEVEKVLTFHDSACKKATQMTTVHVQANHTGLQILWFRNIAADGPIDNFIIDGRPIPVTNKNLLRQKAGSWEVAKEFPHPLMRGEQQKVILSYDVTDAYNGLREGVTTCCIDGNAQIENACTVPRRQARTRGIIFYGKGRRNCRKTHSAYPSQ